MKPQLSMSSLAQRSGAITADAVNRLARTRVEDCYQCGKCTAGCPVAGRADLMPNQIVRLAQCGELSVAVRSRTIWLCVSCQACTQRCPKGVDVAGVMDAARQLSARRADVHPDVVRTVVFQRAFLETIRRYGRLRELELIIRFKGSAFFRDRSLPLLFKDALLAPRLLSRRKLHLRADRVADQDLVARIVDRCLAQDRGIPAGESEDGE